MVLMVLLDEFIWSSIDFGAVRIRGRVVARFDSIRLVNTPSFQLVDLLV